MTPVPPEAGPPYPPPPYAAPSIPMTETIDKARAILRAMTARARADRLRREREEEPGTRSAS
ncbi:hypothetical protein [Bailinhaonella thermotolerans]|uniref:Uncharacterized protein n=1 Tax=Bailinhaonella thermotolerans TaxID=1070861 RepID=A0A3A4B6U1_9ACTN|nr:hypothetical protein [Bailinhaonella thermotolerans]RJL34287.1 hypothetical protein D5H75_07465 [Bailinhaonella thermotolerans]